MTIDEAIKEFTECAKADRKQQNYWAAERDETSPFSSAECVQLAEDCETRAEYNEQLAEWLTELKEAKRLLKAAVPIINNTFPETGSCWGCANHDEAKDECKGGAFEECSEVCKWEHADEALKLIES